MRRMRMIGVGLAALFALVVMASSASAAQPVFYGVAELNKEVKTPIKQSGTFGASFLEGNVSKAQITCKKGTSTGEVVGPTKSTNNIAVFEECETGGLKCTSAGEATGVIKTAKLDGVLGNVSATLPGIRVFKEGEGGKTPKSGALAEFNCGGVAAVVVKGSVIGSLSGAQGKTVEEGKFVTSGKLTFAQSGGVQKYLKFLTGECGGNANDCGPEQLESNTNGGAFEKGGQSQIVTLKTVPFAGKLGSTK
jgi:hypothetical protein